MYVDERIDLKRNKLVHHHVPFAVFPVLLSRRGRVMMQSIGTHNLVVSSVMMVRVHSVATRHMMTRLRCGCSKRFEIARNCSKQMMAIALAATVARAADAVVDAFAVAVVNAPVRMD